MRIYFKKLLNGHYPIEIEMEMINWFLKTGNKYDEFTGRWNKDGVSKQIFNYSANSHSCSFPFPIVYESNYVGNNSFSFNILEGFIQNVIFNAIVKEPTVPVKKWRDAEKIFIDKYRIFEFKEEYPKEKHKDFQSVYWALLDLKNFIGMPLKKELFHPDYEKRTKPKIVSLSFYTNGSGYILDYVFSFENFKYEPGWNRQICQKKDENIPSFLNRIFFEMDLVRDVG